MKKLESKTKAELIEDINRLTESLVIKERTVEAFKIYDQKRKREFTELQLKLAHVIEHRNDLDKGCSEQKRKITELKVEIAKLSDQNFKLNDEVEELLLQIYGDKYDSDDIKFNADLKASLLKPVDECNKLREKVTQLTQALQTAAPEYYTKELDALKSEIKNLKEDKNEIYRDYCNARAIINASNDASKVEGAVKANVSKYINELKHRTNECEELRKQVEKLKSRIRELTNEVD